MFARRCVPGLSLLCLALFVAGCAVPSGLDSIAVSPATQALTVGQTAQFSAVGTFGNSKHLTTQDITSSVAWTSSVPSVATISSAGVATAVGAGTTTITGSTTSYNGSHTTSSGTLVVTGSSGGSSGGSIVSLAIIPGAQSVSAPTQTSQFLAIGTTSSGATVNLTNQVAWSSSSTQIATVGATTGLATAVGKGNSTITAIYNNVSGGTVVTGSATFNVTGGATQQYTAISITPNSQALSASGQTSQLVALATSGSTGLQQDVTNSSTVTWSSSIPSIASVSATGLVTGLSAGNDTITALLTNPDGSVVSSTATVAVSITPAPEPLLSLTIIPSTISVGNLQGTGQFLAIGTYATPPYVRDLTNSPNLTWISSFPNDFPVNTNSGGNAGASAGIVTAYAAGSATIIAEATNPADGTIQTATATFNCPLNLPNPNGDPPTPGTCIQGTQAPSLLETLTVYNEGLNTTTWQLTAPSATAVAGDAPVLHCGPGWGLNGGTGGSVCVATYPLGTTVILKAAGGAFGGWSYNCKPSLSNGATTNPDGSPIVITEGGPNYCSITFSPAVTDSNGNVITPANTQVTVGAIFN